MRSLIGKNLITNPDFESGVWSWTGYLTTLTRDSSQQYSGGYSLKAVGTTVCVAYYDLTLIAGQAYTLQMRVKGAAGTVVYMTSRSNGSSATTTLTGGWDLITWTFTPTVASNTSVEVHCDSSSTTLYIDSVMLEYGSTASSYTPHTGYRYKLRGMGKSLLFNGTSDYMTIPNEIPSTAAHSFCCWITPTTAAFSQRFIDWSDSGPTGGFNVSISSLGNYNYLVYDSGGSIVTSFLNAGNAVPVRIGVPVHIAVSFAPTAARFYVNGIQIDGTDTTSAMGVSSSILTFGRRSVASPTNFAGFYMDDFAFVNGRGITQNEVLAHMCSGINPSDATTILNFNDNVIDQSGNGNSGVLTGTTYSDNVPVTTRRSIRNMGQSLSFNGSSKLSVAHSTPLNISGNVTVGCWAKNIDVGGSGYASLITKGDLECYSLDYDQANRRFRFIINRASSGYQSVSAASNSAVNDRWYFVAGVYDSTAGVMRLYIDGKLTAISTCAPENLKTTSVGLGIGYRNGANDRYITAKIDEPFVYNHGASSVLTQQQIQQIYNDGIYPSSKSADLAWASHLDGNATDISGNNNNGVIDNASFSGDVALTGRRPVNYNMVKNGYFENAPTFVGSTASASKWIDGTVSGSSSNDTYGWHTSSTFNGVGYFDTDTKYSGAASMKLYMTSPSSGTGGGAVGMTQILSPTAALQRKYMAPCKPNTTYNLTAMVKTDSVSSANSGGARLVLLAYNGTSTSSVSVTNGTLITGTNDWALQTVTVTTPATANYLAVWLQLYNETGAAWFDEVELHPGTPIARVAL